MITNLRDFNDSLNENSSETRAQKYIKSVKGVDLIKHQITHLKRIVTNTAIKDSIKEAIFALPKRKDLTEEYEKLAFRLLDLINTHKTIKEMIIEMDFIITKFKKMNNPLLHKGTQILEDALNTYLDQLE